MGCVALFIVGMIVKKTMSDGKSNARQIDRSQIGINGDFRSNNRSQRTSNYNQHEETPEKKKNDLKQELNDRILNPGINFIKKWIEESEYPPHYNGDEYLRSDVDLNKELFPSESEKTEAMQAAKERIRSEISSFYDALKKFANDLVRCSQIASESSLVSSLMRIAKDLDSDDYNKFINFLSKNSDLFIWYVYITKELEEVAKFKKINKQVFFLELRCYYLKILKSLDNNF